MHNGTFCPHSCSFLLLLKESMYSTPKCGTSLIGPVNGIFANVQPARAYNFVFLPMKFFCPLRSLCTATWFNYRSTLSVLCVHANFFMVWRCQMVMPLISRDAWTCRGVRFLDLKLMIVTLYSKNYYPLQYVTFCQKRSLSHWLSLVGSSMQYVQKSWALKS